MPKPYEPKEPKVEPSFSANKLAEYMVANPSRRQTLIMDQVAPAAYRANRYVEARRVLAHFCSNPDRASRELVASAGILRDRAGDPANSENQRDAFIDSARAIEAFQGVAYDARVSGLVAMIGKRQDADLTIGDLRVTVNPDMFYLERGTERHVGAAKFHFSRTEPLNDDALKYVATLLKQYIGEHGGKPKAMACLAIDVFSGRVETAPKAFMARMKNLHAASREIVQRWPALYVEAMATYQAKVAKLKQ